MINVYGNHYEADGARSCDCAKTREEPCATIDAQQLLAVSALWIRLAFAGPLILVKNLGLRSGAGGE